jgi:gluconate kinase
VKRVAVFGNAGGGKSTLARRLAEVTGLPLYPLDSIHWRRGGVEVPHDEYLAAHAEILRRSTLGCYRTIWLCHRRLTPAYRELVAEARHDKRVFHLRSPADIDRCVAEVKQLNR